MMAQMNLVMRLMLLLPWLIVFTCSCASQHDHGKDYLIDACSVTRYRDLCIDSLTSFSSVARHNPTTWARAGVSVTIGEAKRVAQYLAMLKRSRMGYPMRGRDRIALSDCIECFQDALDNLYRSLGVLRHLSAREFTSQLGDVTTWISAALTDEDTCADGFDEPKGKHVRYLINHVSNVTCLTSNALALVNRLATTGP